MASLYKRGRVWWLEYVQQNGERVQKSLKTRDKKTAEFKQKETEVGLTKGTLVHLKKSPFDEVLTEYEQYCTATKTRSTVQRDKSVLKQFLAQVQPKPQTLADLTHSQVEAHIVRLRKDGKAPKTINRFLEVIRALANWAIHQGYLAENPATKVKKLRVPKDPPRFLTSAEIDQLLTAAKDSHLLPMIATGVYAGLRLGELLHLEWTDIDFDRKVLTVQNKHELGFGTKSKKFRTVPLNGRLAEILDPFKKIEGFCFPAEDGKRYASAPKRPYDAVLAKTGFKGVGWHTLRHTFASRLVQEGVSIYKVSQWLGHSSVQTTMIYAHLMPERDADIDRM